MANPQRNTITGYDFTKDAPLHPRKAMRLKCLECMGGSSKLVKECCAIDCGLWPYRLGRGVCVNREGVMQKTCTGVHSFDAQREIKQGRG